MTKLLLLVVVALAVALWLRHASRARGERADPSTRIEDMARCKVCGVHLPRSEAIESQGRTYCCDAHRRLDQG